MENIIYLPYWRFRGMHFSVVPFEIRHKVLDINRRATEHDFLPESAGLRAQAMRLRFAAPGTGAQFLHPALPLRDAISLVEGSSHFTEYGTSAEDAFHRAFVGETMSIVYSPFYIEGRGIYDAILERPVARYTALRADALASSDDRDGKWNPEFTPALCPHCGWDLEGGRESVALFCRNCARVWTVSGGNFRELLFAFSASMGSPAGDEYHFPFWRMRVEIEHGNSVMRTRGDFLRVANLYGGMQGGRDHDGLCFWSPAFRLSPSTYLRLARQVTLCGPGSGSGEKVPRGGLCPVGIGLEESARALKVIMASVAVSKGEVFPDLPTMKVNLRDALLVYIPFRQGGHEFVQPGMSLSIPRNAIRIEGPSG